MNQLDIKIYQDRINRESEELDAQWENVKKFGFTDDMKPQIIKNHVKEYFIGISCDFNESRYNEALKL